MCDSDDSPVLPRPVRGWSLTFALGWCPAPCQRSRPSHSIFSRAASVVKSVLPALLLSAVLSGSCGMHSASISLGCNPRILNPWNWIPSGVSLRQFSRVAPPSRFGFTLLEQIRISQVLRNSGSGAFRWIVRHTYCPHHFQ